MKPLQIWLAATLVLLIGTAACMESEALVTTALTDEGASTAAPPVEVQAPAPQPDPTHLQIRGTRFVRPDGTPFEWRGITAFRLLELIARDRAPDAEAFLDWCSAQGLTVVRVLTTARHLFALSPEDGRAALPRLLEMAAARRLHVEIVALADTAGGRVDIDRHVRDVGAIAARHGNAIVELANEPPHPTQSRRIHEPSALAVLARHVPDAVPVALGSGEDDGYAAGDYATVHFPRADHWRHVAELAKGADLLRRWGKPVVNDEPIGAGDRLEPGRRDDNPERFRAASLLSRMTGMDATFHYEDGLYARVPRGRQLECFEAWREAWTLLPADGEPTLMRPGDPGSPVRSVTGDFAGAYVSVRDDRASLLVIGTRGEIVVTWAEAWLPAKRHEWAESIWWPAGRSK